MTDKQPKPPPLDAKKDAIRAKQRAEAAKKVKLPKGKK